MAGSSADGRRSEAWLTDTIGGEWRCWESHPVVLPLIFTRIPADELARTAPLVCRGWREALLEPYCWSEIDIMKWTERVYYSDVIDAAVMKLVSRSRYTLRRLSANHIGNSGFSLAASFGTHLKVLQIPASKVDDTAIEQFSGNLKALQVLDISFCNNITSKGIAIFGENCTSLINLRRKLSDPQFKLTEDANKIYEGEALAVANTMSGLQKLELTYGRFSDYGLDAILTNCKALSSLDLRGCSHVKLAGSVGLRCYELKSFTDHYFDPEGYFPSSSTESEYSGGSEY